ncbi:hypothetical protein [Rufibacter latericius]|uniref:Uncharacterized protein n=1 Tax=Rufibacter latericius TaxID=2487040 RepID=A0A3M9MU98_9BACT|nr:hypothetical protein [Rufibacter latericius]RNI29094.1 hypothetical protein EFB08_06590 [Rufibacter latericius]
MKAEVIISHNGAKLVLNEEGQQEVINLAAERLAGKLAEEEIRNRVYTIPNWPSAWSAAGPRPIIS